MKKIYVFDLDGTLVDSMPYYKRGMLNVLDDAGISYCDDLIKIITPLGYEKTAQYYIDNMGLEDTVENIVAKMRETLLFEYKNNIRLKAGVGEYLRKIHAEGGRLFVLTASPHIATDACLKNNGVYDLFETVWSVDDFGLTKSGTELFYKVAETIGCEPEDINYFEDNLIAVGNAAKAGYNTYGVYDAGTADEEPLMRKTSNKYIKSFEELL